jgi:hypothetical protein
MQRKNGVTAITHAPLGGSRSVTFISTLFDAIYRFPLHTCKSSFRISIILLKIFQTKAPHQSMGGWFHTHVPGANHAPHAMAESLLRCFWQSRGRELCRDDAGRRLRRGCSMVVGMPEEVFGVRGFAVEHFHDAPFEHEDTNYTNWQKVEG